MSRDRCGFQEVIQDALAEAGHAFARRDWPEVQRQCAIADQAAWVLRLVGEPTSPPPAAIGA